MYYFLGNVKTPISLLLQKELKNEVKNGNYTQNVCYLNLANS